MPRPVTQLLSYHTTNRWPLFLPDGRHFLYLASNHQDWGEASPLAPQVYRLQSTWRGNFDASESGQLIFYSSAGQRGSQLLWVEANGKTIAPLGERAFIHDLRLSPDGRKLAVGAGDPSNDVWIYDTSRGSRTRITFEGVNGPSIWSPDGTRIAYAKRHGGHLTST